MKTWSISNTGYWCTNCDYYNFNPLLFHMRKIVDQESPHPKGNFICNSCDSPHTRVVLVRI